MGGKRRIEVPVYLYTTCRDGDDAEPRTHTVYIDRDRGGDMVTIRELLGDGRESDAYDVPRAHLTPHGTSGIWVPI